MRSIEHKIDARKNALNMNISLKPKFDTMKRNCKKLTTNRLVDISKKRGGNILEENLNLKISMPLERTQVENISEERCEIQK